MPDLWPDDIANINIRSPLSVLKEQASLLGDRTANVVQGLVTTTDKRQPIWAREDDQFIHTFWIASPALNDYQYRLFDISHTIELYPVTFDLGEKLGADVIPTIARFVSKGAIIARNEEEFVEILKAIFTSKRSRDIIQALLAQFIT